MLNKRVVKYLEPNVIRRVNNHNIKNDLKQDKIKNAKYDDSKQIPLSNIITILNKTKNKRVFIVGGGASLSGFNFSLLENEDVIVVNKAIEYVNRAKYFITMDYTFIKNPNKLKNTDFNIIKEKAEKSYFIINTEPEYIKNINGVYVDTRYNLKYEDLNKFDGVIKSNRSFDSITGFGIDVFNFTHGQNSGYCAIQLALILGYEEIYLLGIDMVVNSNLTHFHNAYNQNIDTFYKNLINYRAIISNSLNLFKGYFNSKIYSCSKISYLNNFVEYKDINYVLKNDIQTNQLKTETINNIDNNIRKSDLSKLIIIGYYTLNTPYEQEAQNLINSCKKLNLKYDIIGINNLGNWQSNTRFKAKFILDMLKKYPGYNLLYVDCDAVIHSKPVIFSDYDYDISVRYQDFRWRKNECLSGTIFINSNERTIKLCQRWIEINNSEGPNAKTLEQWNLDKAIQEGIRDYGLKFKNLPPEYTFIFDTMRQIFPNAKPVIEHFQASRRYRNKINK